MQQFTISENESGRRLDQYVMRLLPGAGSSLIYRMIRKKNITVNRKKTEGNARLSAGDTVEMFFAEDTFAALSSGRTAKTLQTENHPTDGCSEYLLAYRKIGSLDIIYEDSDFIFADKPSGILSQKAEREDTSMNEWLIGYLCEKGEVTENSLKTFKPAFTNRLDRNTSGIMLGGKSLKGLQVLSELLRSRNMHKFYLAQLEGTPDDGFNICKDEFTDYYAYLTKDKKNNKVRVRDAKGESLIHTGCRLITVNESDHTMQVEIELFTGKSHQIRAHMAYLGHPLVGDPKYGHGRAGRDFQELRAYRVVFPHLEEFPAISDREFRVN